MLETQRLRLRPWRPDDHAPFAAINADARVMRYFPSPMTVAQTEAAIERIAAHFERFGFGLWAVELTRLGEFIGFIGLSVPQFEATFTPCVEIGWRLAPEHWNQGLATEGARAVLDLAFDRLSLNEVVSLTATDNWPSRRVMEKIGMIRNPADDFDHPLIPEGHPLRRHVLYRATLHRSGVDR